MASTAQIAARKKFAAIMKSGGFGKKRKKNPASAPPAGTTKRQTLNGVKKKAAVRRKNPVRVAPKRAAPARRRNPVEGSHRPPSGYHVHLVNSHGEAGSKLATFVEKPKAVEYARGYAHKHNKQLCILGKK